MNKDFLYNRGLHPVTPGNNQNDDSLMATLMVYLRMFMRRKLIILFLLLTGFFITVFLTALVRPNYIAQATIMIETEKPSFVPGQQSVSGHIATERKINSEIAILQSMPLLMDVVRKMDLVNNAKEDKTIISELIQKAKLYVKDVLQIETVPLTEEEKTEIIASTIKRKLDIQLIPKTALIKIEYSAQDQEFPQQLVNEIANTYLRQQWDTQVKASENATTWLNERIQKLGQKLRDSERELHVFKSDNNLFSAGGGTLNEKQFVSLNEQIIVAQTKYQELKLRHEQLAKVFSQNKGIDKFAGVVETKAIENLRVSYTDAAKREAELLSRYNARHPRVRAVRAELRDINKQLDAEARRELARAKNEHEIARIRVEALEKSLSQNIQNSSLSKKASIRLQELQQDVAANRALYKSFLERFKQMSEQKTLDYSNFRLISEADSRKANDLNKNRLKVMLVGLVGTFLFAFGFAFLLENLDRTFRTRKQAETELGLPCLVSMPLIKRSDLYKNGSVIPIADYAMSEPKSNFANALSALSYELRHFSPDTAHKVFLLSSAVPDEGKTLLTLSLARYLAQKNYKVLVVDADLRRASLSEKILGANLETSLVDVLQDNVKWSEAIHTDYPTKLDVIPSTTGEYDYIELLSSPHMKTLIDEAREIYDYILIDAPPIMPVPDVHILQGLADISTLVVEWGRTPRSVATEAVRIFNAKGINLSAFVLNKANTKELKKYEPYAKHYGYYGQMKYNY